MPGHSRGICSLRQRLPFSRLHAVLRRSSVLSSHHRRISNFGGLALASENFGGLLPSQFGQRLPLPVATSSRAPPRTSNRRWRLTVRRLPSDAMEKFFLLQRTAGGLDCDDAVHDAGGVPTERRGAVLLTICDPTAALAELKMELLGRRPRRTSHGRSGCGRNASGTTSAATGARLGCDGTRYNQPTLLIKLYNAKICWRLGAGAA